MWKINEIRTLPHIILNKYSQNGLKNYVCHDMVNFYKTTQENILKHKSQQFFFRSVSQGKRNKRKNKQMGPN